MEAAGNYRACLAGLGLTTLGIGKCFGGVMRGALSWAAHPLRETIPRPPIFVNSAMRLPRSISQRAACHRHQNSHH